MTTSRLIASRLPRSSAWISGLDRARVPYLAVHPLDRSDVDVLDRVAQLVHLQRTPRVIGDLHLPERGEEPLLVLGVAVNGPQRIVVEPRGRVALRRIYRRRALVTLPVGRRELLVGRGVQRRTVDERGDDAQRLV